MLSQIQFDEVFIKKLLEQLKVGNARSIHLNAVPGRSAARLDLNQLSLLNGQNYKYPQVFMEKLLNEGSFNFNILYNNVSDPGQLTPEKQRELVLMSRRLNNMVIENNDNYLEYGSKNFGFGYPLLIKRDQKDPDKIIKAPLFIWSLDIERTYNRRNEWSIKKEEDSPVKINELLISYLSNNDLVQVNELPNEELTDGALGKDKLLELSNKILLQLNVQVNHHDIKIENCPSASDLELITTSSPWIQWSGVFGIYKSPKQTIINSTEELLEKINEFQDEVLELSQFQKSTISAIETDPSKEEIINTLTKDEIKLIQGPPGTGKSQSITAIIANALANNAKCLIVCEKKTALDVIQDNLEDAGLGDFSIIIDDVNKDRRKVIKKARLIKDEIPREGRWVQSEEIINARLQDDYQRFCQLKKEVNQKYAENSPDKKVFLDYSWKHLIGLYLKHSKFSEKNPIDEVLNYDDLKFNDSEYFRCIQAIEEASYLYKNLEQDQKIEEIFCILHPSLFVSQYTGATFEAVKNKTQQIETILKDINSFLVNKQEYDYCINNVSIFSPKDLEELNDLVVNIINNCTEIQNLYKEGVGLTGKRFNKKNNWSKFILKISSPLISRSKEICLLKKKILSLYSNSAQLINDLKKFNFYLKLKEEKDIFLYQELINEVHSALLKAKDIKSKINKIKTTKFKIQEFEQCLKNEKNEFFDFKVLDFLELKNYESVKNHYQELKSKVKRAVKYIDFYENFHNWKFFYNNQDRLELQVLSILRNIPTDSWKSVFLAWYYKGILLNYESISGAELHRSDHGLQQLTKIYQDLKEEQVGQIKVIWNNERKKLLKDISFQFNLLYNLRTNRLGPRNSLRRIVNKDFNLFTALFPVILTNPGVVNAIFPLKQGIFNIVIFDEASQLRVSDTFTSLIRGQYKIIAGDEHQMPPSSYFQSTVDAMDIESDDSDDFNEADEQMILAQSESLLKYASDLSRVNKSYLNFHYRSNHPALIEFSNNAFYGKNLVSFPPKDDYKPIEFRHIGGVYKNGTNLDEAQEVLNIINNEIKLNEKGEYPSIGVATFNIHQRNLISNKINEVAEENPEFANKFQQLINKGFFVKNLENIQGDEKDVIIISTTYGIQPDGRFIQNFARINRIEGYKLLNVLITRAKRKLYVCTSIPKERYLAYPELIQNEGNNKRGIFYAYLAYAEAISNQQVELADNILKILKQQSPEAPYVNFDNQGLLESPFEEEVYELLKKHFHGGDIFPQYKVGGWRIDFLIKTKDHEIALECDGKTYHASEEAYAYDMYRQKELEEMGYRVYRIWSTNWFQNKDLELKKLLKFIKDQK